MLASAGAESGSSKLANDEISETSRLISSCASITSLKYSWHNLETLKETPIRLAMPTVSAMEITPEEIGRDGGQCIEVMGYKLKALRINIGSLGSRSGRAMEGEIVWAEVKLINRDPASI